MTVLFTCVTWSNLPQLSKSTTSLPHTHGTTLMHFYCPHLLFFLPPLHHCLCLCLDHLCSILIPHLPYCTHCVLPFRMHCSFLTLAFPHFNLHVRRTTFFQPVHLSLSSLPPPSMLRPSACRNSSSNCRKSHPVPPI